MNFNLFFLSLSHYVLIITSGSRANESCTHTLTCGGIRKFRANTQHVQRKIWIILCVVRVFIYLFFSFHLRFVVSLLCRLWRSKQRFIYLLLSSSLSGYTVHAGNRGNIEVRNFHLFILGFFSCFAINSNEIIRYRRQIQHTKYECERMSSSVHYDYTIIHICECISWTRALYTNLLLFSVFFFSSICIVSSHTLHLNCNFACSISSIWYFERNAIFKMEFLYSFSLSLSLWSSCVDASDRRRKKETKWIERRRKLTKRWMRQRRRVKWRNAAVGDAV